MNALSASPSFVFEEQMVTNVNMPSHNSLNVYFGKSNGELLRYYNCRSVSQSLAYDTNAK